MISTGKRYLAKEVFAHNDKLIALTAERDRLRAALKLAEQYIDPDYQGGIACPEYLLEDIRAALGKSND